MSVFDNRTLNEDEQRNLKIAVESTMSALREIKDLQDSMKDNNKGICDSLNSGVKDDEMKIKPSLITKMAKARLKEEYIKEAKDSLSEVETAIRVVYKES